MPKETYNRSLYREPIRYIVTMDTSQLRKTNVSQMKSVDVPVGLRPIHMLLTSHGWATPTTASPIFDNQATSPHHHVVLPHKRATSSSSSSPKSPTFTCELTYVKDPSSDDEFRVRTSSDKVTVAVPIANAPYLYASSFKNYFAATEFVERHLAAYEKKMTRATP